MGNKLRLGFLSLDIPNCARRVYGARANHRGILVIPVKARDWRAVVRIHTAQDLVLFVALGLRVELPDAQELRSCC